MSPVLGEFYLVIQVKGINQWRLGALRPHLLAGNAPGVTPAVGLSNGTVGCTVSQNSSQLVTNGKLPDGYISFFELPNTLFSGNHLKPCGVRLIDAKFYLICFMLC